MTIWLTMSPLALLFWAAYAAMTWPEMLGAFFQRERQAGRRQDRGTEFVLVAGIINSQIVAINLAPRWVAGRISADQAAFVIIGVVLMLLGVALRWYAIRVLGRFFTRNIAIREDHRIVQDGPYRYVRHPSYSGFLLAVLGLGIALDNWASLVILLVVNFGVFIYRMHVEEAALSAAFGPAYADYQRRTKQVIPLVF